VQAAAERDALAVALAKAQGEAAGLARTHEATQAAMTTRLAAEQESLAVAREALRVKVTLGRAL
jgi:hypothetical protein